MLGNSNIFDLPAATDTHPQDGSKSARRPTRDTARASAQEGCKSARVRTSSRRQTPRKGQPRDAAEVAASAVHKFFPSPEATVHIKDLAEYLLTLEWPRPADEVLDMKINKLHDDAKRAELARDNATLEACRNLSLRLEGAKTRKLDVGLVAREESSTPRKTRVDVFSQSLLRPHRLVDDLSGRRCVKVDADTRLTHFGS